VRKGTGNMTEICNPFSQNATISMSSCYAQLYPKKKIKEILMYQRKIMVSWIFHTLFSQAGVFTFS